MEVFLLFWLVCAIAAGFVASSKGRSGIGWAALGVLFGPLAVLAAAAISSDGRLAIKAGLQDGKLRRCPSCAEPVRKEATICRYCSSPLPPPPARDIWGREVRP